jgi:hypothetical protein
MADNFLRSAAYSGVVVIIDDTAAGAAERTDDEI